MATWICCRCKLGPNLVANCPKRCSTCPHFRCPSCYSGPPSPIPGSPRGLFSSQTSARPPHNNDTSFYEYQPSRPAKYARSIVPRHFSLPTAAATQQYDNIRSVNSAPPTGSRSPYLPSRQGPASHNQLMRRPSMEGWWPCSHCGESNNPVLAPDKCSTCDQPRN